MESFNRRQEIKNKRQENDFKEKIILNYTLARTIGEHISGLFNKNAKITPIEEMFPGLFDKEIKELQEKEEKRQMELYKARFIDFAYRHNNARKKKGVK